METVEVVLQHISALESWLHEKGVDVKFEHGHIEQFSHERLYWHFGYLVGLRDALNALVRNESQTLH